MNYSLEWLLEKFDAEEKYKYLFFWGHQPCKDETISSSCLSQWWEEPFEVNKIVYRTAEHWMMAEKAKLFGDTEILEKIIACKSPAAAKKMGRKVRGFDPNTWDKERYSIVVKGNYHKFNQNKALKEFLLSTQKRILVEASPVDTIWGIGLAKTSKNVENPHTWRGLNLLGFALMSTRDLLMKEHKSD